MCPDNRRKFIKKTVTGTAGIIIGAPLAKNVFAESPNDRINIAVVGIRSRGAEHCRQFSQIPNVRVTTICDVDERLFPKAVNEIKEFSGEKPKTVVDFREILEDESIDAVSLATPDHWHALHSIWACQAGKDVYVEKPVSYTIDEGRKMVEAARKYKRVVQVGTQSRSDHITKEAIKFLQEGKLGDIYLARGVYYGPRESIGHKPDSDIPEGVNWGLFLGPAPYRPFNENRFHYTWHWFWDTSTTDMGNNGIHIMDKARWGMNKRVHPVKVHCSGGYFVFDSDQETPNTQVVVYEYDDGTLVECEIRNLYTNLEQDMRVGNFFYGSEGWMYLKSGEFRTYFGRKNEPGPFLSAKDIKTDSSELDRKGVHAGIDPHFVNFINSVRSRKWQNLNADILEGHMSTAMCHMANISYRTGRALNFNPYSETFIDDADANNYLTRQYRYPHVLPDKI
ncbi:MAG: Gfo/Idh/MocA family oxidoreductase [Bacteroidetes bacterium]|nr:Gfo/Idh/MocA family oxidoreductase [Bacteroidota bacterium]